MRSSTAFSNAMAVTEIDEDDDMISDLICDVNLMTYDRSDHHLSLNIKDDPDGTCKGSVSFFLSRHHDRVSTELCR